MAASEEKNFNFDDVIKLARKAVGTVEFLVLEAKKGQFKKALVTEILKAAFPRLTDAEVSVVIEMAVARLNSRCGCFGVR